MKQILRAKPLINKLLSQLLVSSYREFTGKLDLHICAEYQWSLYFDSGNLIWATGGIHTNRRWHRLMSQHSAVMSIKGLSWRDKDQYECWDHHVLAVLIKRNLISMETGTKVITDIITEVLFDIVQKLEQYSLKHGSSARYKQKLTASSLSATSQDTQTTGINLVYQPDVRPSQSAILACDNLLSVRLIIGRVVKLWSNWVQAGLKFCSPNLAPVVQHDVLCALPTGVTQHHTKGMATATKKFMQMLDGHHTLRELAYLTKQDLVSLTRWLLPYVRQKKIKFMPVSDWHLPNKNYLSLQSPCLPQVPVEQKRSLVVACIDDSPLTGLLMKQTLEPAGYRFLWIHNELQALPLLLQHKPDLIFLDLTMNMTNGYEICSQIRRLDSFQQTPIIMIAGRDGVVDRMRAKMVGVTELIPKPMKSEQVIETLQRLLN